MKWRTFLHFLLGPSLRVWFIVTWGQERTVPFSSHAQPTANTSHASVFQFKTAAFWLEVPSILYGLMVSRPLILSGSSHNRWLIAGSALTLPLLDGSCPVQPFYTATVSAGWQLLLSVISILQLIYLWPIKSMMLTDDVSPFCFRPRWVKHAPYCFLAYP